MILSRFPVSATVLVAGLLIPGTTSRAAQQRVQISIADGSRIMPLAVRDGGKWAPACGDSASTSFVVNSPTLTADGAEVQRVRTVTSTDPEWPAIDAAIREIFRQREREQNIAPSRLASAPVGIDVVTAAGEGDRRSYFFHASKTIRDPRARRSLDQDDVDLVGDLTIDVTGWLRPTPSGIVSAGSAGSLRWELADAGGTVAPRSSPRPIGVVLLETSQLWVTSEYIGNRTRALLYDVGQTVMLRLIVNAIGC